MTLGGSGLVVVAVLSSAGAGADAGGNAGDPTPRCLGERATEVGTAGPDFIRASNRRDDVIVAAAGHDEIEGRGGDDIVCAGPGNDQLIGGRGADRLSAGAGTDEVQGGNGDDVIDGGPGADRGTVPGFGEPVSAGLIGGGRANVGGSGDDRIRGGGGGDALIGQDGADRLDGEGGRDRCSAGSGRDRVKGCEL